MAALNSESLFVLYEADWSGSCTLALRREDPQRRFIVMRKALSVTRITDALDHRELVHTTAELENDCDVRHPLLCRFGRAVRSVFLAAAVARPARDAAGSQRLAVFDVGPPSLDQHLAVYENLWPVAVTASEYWIPMPTLDHDIAIPMARRRHERRGSLTAL